MAGITWIGLLYYFNFVQTPFFAETEAGTRTGAIQKLVPRALWWFRWGAMFTYLTGLVLLHGVAKMNMLNDYIVVGAVMGTLMFLNVWLIIWPNQKIALGIDGAEGDKAKAGRTAMLFSRTNTMLSIPMLYAMTSAQNIFAS